MSRIAPLLRQLVLLMSGLLASALPLMAVDVGVLVDVSGSLKPLPTERGKALLISLILEGNIPPDWKVSGADEDHPLVKRIRDGQPGPLLEPGERFLFMTFGSRRSRTYPFFEPPKIHTFENSNQIKDLINLYYPNRHLEAFTFDDLSRAVASEEFRKQGSPRWYLFIVSDFQSEFGTDQNQPFTPEQEQLTSDFDVQKSFKWENPLILRHKRNNRLMMKVYDIRPKIVPPQPPVPPSAKEVKEPREQPPPKPEPVLTLNLLEPRGEVTQNPPRFRWSQVPGAGSYVVKCITSEGRQVFETERTTIELQPPHPYPKGDYQWLVSAYTADGRELIRSAPAAFTLGGNNEDYKGILLYLVGGAILAGGGLYWLNRQGYLAAIIAALRRKLAKFRL